MGTTKTVAELVLRTEEEKAVFLGLERALRDLHGDGRTDLAPGEDVLWTWMPKHGRIFHYAAERFPGFMWKPVVRAVKGRGGSVVLHHFVQFDGFPFKDRKALTLQELLTVDPQIVDLPRVKKVNSVRPDWRAAQRARRAIRRNGMFV